MAYILRRRKLGRTSCREISRFTNFSVVLNGRDALPEDPDDICIRWGCTATVFQRKVINKAEAIHLVSDKTAFRQVMSKHKLCPETYTKEEEVTTFPVIVRPRTHHQGRNLHFCKTRDDFEIAVDVCGDGWYASPFINKTAEYRVFVVQGRAVAVAQKTPADPNAIAWNVAQGGRFDNVRWGDWPLKVVKTSIEAFLLSGLDFGGVDVMVDNDNNVYVLEINAAPSLTSPYRQEMMAKGIAWLVQKGKAVIPLTPERGGYRKFIHPAVCNEAII